MPTSQAAVVRSTGLTSPILKLDMVLSAYTPRESSLITVTKKSSSPQSLDVGRGVQAVESGTIVSPEGMFTNAASDERVRYCYLFDNWPSL